MENKITSFQELEAWKKSHKLVLEVYRITQTFPKEELYALTSQIRRAAYSVPMNIAEGFKRKGLPEKLRFYNISEASLEELRYCFILIKDLGYYEKTDDFHIEIDEIAKLLGTYCSRIQERMAKTKL